VAQNYLGTSVFLTVNDEYKVEVTRHVQDPNFKSASRKFNRKISNLIYSSRIKRHRNVQ